MHFEEKLKAFALFIAIASVATALYYMQDMLSPPPERGEPPAPQMCEYIAPPYDIREDIEYRAVSEETHQKAYITQFPTEVGVPISCIVVEGAGISCDWETFNRHVAY